MWQPQVVVTDDENGGYGHPDHIMCHRVTVGAFRAAGDPVAYPDAGPPWHPSRLYMVAQVSGRWARVAEAMLREGLDTSWVDRRSRSDTNRLPGEAVTAAIDVTPYVARQREGAAPPPHADPGRWLLGHCPAAPGPAGARHGLLRAPAPAATPW